MKLLEGMEIVNLMILVEAYNKGKKDKLDVDDFIKWLREMRSKLKH